MTPEPIVLDPGQHWEEYADTEYQAHVAEQALTFPDPEDRGDAVLSEFGTTEYVEDLIRPGRIVVVGAEEGTGKSYAIDSELGIRVSVAGGSFAGTWTVVQTGPVCYLSEMHPDDDYDREADVLEALHLERASLKGRYYRLALMTAAGGHPCLTVPAWRSWFTEWAAIHGLLLAIFDTGTGATQVDPWGHAIQAVFADLRAMLEAYPALAIVLLVHLKKPSGHGDRRLSDVLGEWGRWCDVVVLLERDGDTRTRVSVRKRVRHERRIVATKASGLLIDPVDLEETKSTKVPADAVLAAIVDHPGLGFAELGKLLGVSKDTASNYARALGNQIVATASGARGAIRLYPATAEPPNTAERARIGGPSADGTTEPRTTAEPPNLCNRFGSRSSVVAADPIQAALNVYGEDIA